MPLSLSYAWFHDCACRVGFNLPCFPTALRVPVLVKHPKEKGKVLANFDPIIFQLIRETDVMLKLGLEVPEEGQMLMCMEKRLKDLHQQLIVSFFFCFS